MSQMIVLDVLARFLNAFGESPVLREFAHSRSLTVAYRLTDMKQCFYMEFKDGAARAALGDPDGKADLELEMISEIFDGVMTGRISGTSAAMSGKIRLLGDAMKIMPMQKVQKEIERLYQAAKAG